MKMRHTMALGALDLIEDDVTPSLFGTGATVARGTGANVEAAGSQDMILPRDTADLVIMNPPFTRPTNHEIAEVPVPSFAGLGRTSSEQQAMAKRLTEIRQRLANPVGHGNAGLASNFVDLAHVKTKPGGVLALVLPASCVSGGSWEDVRRLLEHEYEDLAVLTIAAHGDTDRAFSADTGMAEALVVATKKLRGKQGKQVKRCSSTFVTGRAASQKPLRWHGRYVTSRLKIGKGGYAWATVRPSARISVRL